MKTRLKLICLLSLFLSCGAPRGDNVSRKPTQTQPTNDNAAVAQPSNITQEVTSEQKTQVSDDTVITKRYVEIGGMWDREYELTIRGTGQVTFRGKTGLGKLGGKAERWEIPREDVARIVEAFDRTHFFQLGNEYGKAFD